MNEIRRGPTSVFVPVLLTNAGVLVVLLFGPNSHNPIAPLTYAGAAVALLGVLLIVRNLIARRRNTLFVPPARAMKP